jgi:hypothetical protein
MYIEEYEGYKKRKPEIIPAFFLIINEVII